MATQIFQTPNCLPDCEGCRKLTKDEVGECPHCGAILCYKCAAKKKCPCCGKKLN